MTGNTYRKNKDVVSRTIAGELFIVPVSGNLADMQRIFVLNSVGEYIWKQLDEQKSLEEICKAVTDRFDVSEETADADVREFISGLLDARLIEG